MNRPGVIGPVAAAALSAFISGPRAAAFHPPVDTAGPLTVRIEAASELSQVQTPIPVRVVLRNDGRDPLQGSLRLAVIDDWRAEPAGPVPFTLEAQAASHLDFTVVAGPGTCSALYPIHALAKFEAQARQLQAHAVLVVETRLPDPPRARPPIEWAPFTVPATGGLALGQLPIHRTVIQTGTDEAIALPAGWAGAHPATGTVVEFGMRIDRGGSRQAIGIHPPWQGGRWGTALVEFPLRLPEGSSVRVRFANAIRDHDTQRGETASDGVTFRVRVAPFYAPAGHVGAVRFERHTDAKVWQEAQVELADFAGQAIRLQLESHPGPDHNTNCDQSYWAEPTLITGTPPEPAPFPPTTDTGSRLIGTLAGPGGGIDVRLWPGRRGLLDAAIGLLHGPKRLFFHGIRARVLDSDLHEWSSPASLIGVQEEPGPHGGYRVRHNFRTWAGTFDLVGEIWAEQEALRAKLWLENLPPARPWLVTCLQDVWAGPWSARAARVYAGLGNVIHEPQAFRLGCDGHQLSTSFVGFDFVGGMSLVQAVDVPPDHLEVEPASRFYTLHAPHGQTMTFIPKDNVWDAVRVWREVNGLQAAGGVAKLAGRFVFDLWGGRYAPSAQALQRAFRYGLTDSVVVWHNWQRWGYDYRLPDIYPPNPQWGTLEEFRGLAQTCREHDVLFAPHDNYIDFYPDAEGFSYEQIAHHRDGQPVRAWFNPGPKAQSYRWRPDRVPPVIERNLRLIRDQIVPTAYFIDVWASIGPHDYWTRDGRFYDCVSTRETWGRSFAWIRDFLGGDSPQISESGHDLLIGWLDGAQANHLRVDVSPPAPGTWFVWRIGCADAERIPWFDAAHHDRFVLHGAGYQDRYCGGLDPRLHGIYSDDYISSEVLTGHPAMVPAPFGRDVVRKYWLLHDLMRALAPQHVETVEFTEGNLHRQHVRWSGGSEAWINRGADDWSVAGHVLPQYGFYARSSSGELLVESAVERSGRRSVEWSRSPGSFYVNPRGALGSPQEAPVAFGGFVTAGAFRAVQEDRVLVLTPLPESPAFTVGMDFSAASGLPPGPVQAEAISETGEALHRSRLPSKGPIISLICEPGVFAYRLSPVP